MLPWEIGSAVTTVTLPMEPVQQYVDQRMTERLVGVLKQQEGLCDRISQFKADLAAARADKAASDAKFEADLQAAQLDLTKFKQLVNVQNMQKAHDSNTINTKLNEHEFGLGGLLLFCILLLGGIVLARQLTPSMLEHNKLVTQLSELNLRLDGLVNSTIQPNVTEQEQLATPELGDYRRRGVLKMEQLIVSLKDKINVFGTALGFVLYIPEYQAGAASLSEEIERLKEEVIIAELLKVRFEEYGHGAIIGFCASDDAYRLRLAASLRLRLEEAGFEFNSGIYEDKYSIYVTIPPI